jgi:hypothetical protein
MSSTCMTPRSTTTRPERVLRIDHKGICQKKIPVFRCQTARCDQPMAIFTQSEHIAEIGLAIGALQS